MENKRLLFITTRRFWPTDSGRKLSLYHYCRGLHNIYGYKIYIYSFLESGQTPENGDEKPCFIYSVTYAKNISFFKKICNIFFRSILTRNKIPLQCSLFFSRENFKAIRGLAENITPQAIIVDMVRLAPYYSAFSQLECKKILDMDDVLSNRYRRQIDFKDSHTSLMGTYTSGRNDFLNIIANNNLFKKVILRYEARLMERAEKYYANIYDSIILVSKKEAEHLKKIVDPTKVNTATMGVDYEYFAEPTDIEKEKNSLSFIGNLKVAANVDSLEFIITKILPLIKCNINLYVVGLCPDDIREKYKEYNNVIFTGVVDDLRKYVKKTQVFLAPIVYGSGVKTKILEAMAMGIPVVTNNIGVEGIDAENGKELFIRDDCVDIANTVNELLSNETLRREIGERGQRFVQQYHDWNCVYKSFEDMGL